MEIKIMILTALIGVIAAFSNTDKKMAKQEHNARDDQPVLPI